MRYVKCFAALLLAVASEVSFANLPTEIITYKTYKPYDSTLVHVITIDPTRAKIIAARAQDMGLGLSTVQEMGKNYAALAAINGGYFRVTSGTNGTTSSGVPAGVLKINQNWHGIAYKTRGALGWDPKRNVVLMDRVQTETQLLIKGKKMPIHAMNILLTGNKATLLSDSYSDTIDVTQSTILLLSNQKIDRIYTSGSFNIIHGAYAYDASGTAQQNIAAIKPGDQYTLQINVIPELNKSNSKAWDNLPFIVGGGPLLITNKRIVTDFSQEKLNADFINSYNARTAVGILPNKHWVLVVAEGGIFQETRGLTIFELAQFMHLLGCTMALNLDGGSSSNMYVNESIRHKSNIGAEVNLLTIGRPVADAILVIGR